MTRKHANRSEQRRQSGSILVLTLLAVGLVAGAFLYVSVIGSRTTEKVRVQTAADATALAAATIKARTMNYAAFVFLANSVLLPLDQVAWNISTAQLAANMPQICALLTYVDPEKGEECIQHLVTTAIQSKIEAVTIELWLSSLQDTGTQLNELGPLWAEEVAALTGTAAAYKTPIGAVDLAASYPIPDGGSCGGLGIEMVDSMTPIEPEGTSACKVESPWEVVYAAMALDPLFSTLDVAAWLKLAPGGVSTQADASLSKVIGLLTADPMLLQWPQIVQHASNPLDPMFAYGVTALSYKAIIEAKTGVTSEQAQSDSTGSSEMPCHISQKVPALGANWRDFRRSIGLAMISNPSEPRMLGRLHSLKNASSTVQPIIGPPGLLGIACAEHYSQEQLATNTESLWHMDWRARLSPCQFKSTPSDGDLVTGCGGAGSPMVTRFTFQLPLMAQDFFH